MALGATLILACTRQGDSADSSLMEQGRLYTSWLYGSQYQKLWDRFSPEMRQAFGSVGELADFAGAAVTRLGAESGAVDERLDQAEPFRIYSRSASFDKAAHRMLIEWSLAEDGVVTGLVLRPEPPARAQPSAPAQ
ncbi:MAG: hypothetical protein H0T44_12560 [Gemmatimonadales bacterium]|nr:hypothetical protein [Gemmatimonadales bacterium]